MCDAFLTQPVKYGKGAVQSWIQGYIITLVVRTNLGHMFTADGIKTDYVPSSFVESMIINFVAPPRGSTMKSNFISRFLVTTVQKLMKNKK